MSFSKPGPLFVKTTYITERVQTVFKNKGGYSPAHIILANDKTLSGGSKCLHNTEIVYTCK